MLKLFKRLLLGAAETFVEATPSDIGVALHEVQSPSIDPDPDPETAQPRVIVDGEIVTNNTPGLRLFLGDGRVLEYGESARVPASDAAEIAAAHS